MQATQTFEAAVENRPPVPVGRLLALSLRAGGVRSVDVSGAFEDPDNDLLTFDAMSSDGLMATASATGSSVRVSAVWPGTVEVTVTAEDPGGLRAEQTFELTVPNRDPVAMGSLPVLTLASGGPPESVDVSSAFEDPEDDPLTFTATSAPTVVAAVVSGTTVEVTPLSGGTAVVSVTATDVGGSNTSATQVFGVGVDGPPPGTGGDGRGGGGGGRWPTGLRGRWASWRTRMLTVGADVASAFDDPDDDELTYAASSSTEDWRWWRRRAAS